MLSDLPELMLGLHSSPPPWRSLSGPSEPAPPPSTQDRHAQQDTEGGRQRVFNGHWGRVLALPPGEWASPHTRVSRGEALLAGAPGNAGCEDVRGRPTLVWGPPAARAPLGWRGAKYRQGWRLAPRPTPQLKAHPLGSEKPPTSSPAGQREWAGAVEGRCKGAGGCGYPPPPHS